METVPVNSNMPPTRADWQMSVNQFTTSVLTLPQVRSGAVEKAQAINWLECVSKLHKPQSIERIINQASGLGAKDIRALIANERQEYYPAIGVNEVYSAKKLESVPLPRTPKIEREGVVTTIARKMLETHYGLTRNKEGEAMMGKIQGGRFPWMISKPTLLGTSGDGTFLYDTHVNRRDTLSGSDEIRLHYHDLVANTRRIKCTELFQANLSIDKSLFSRSRSP